MEKERLKVLECFFHSLANELFVMEILLEKDLADQKNKQLLDCSLSKINEKFKKVKEVFSTNPVES